LEHGQYASNPQDLPVQGQSDYPEGTSVDLVNDDNYAYTIVYNEDKLPDNNFVVFQKHSMQFAGTTMCEARDEAAGEICMALGGTSLSGGVTAGWTAYLLSGQLGAGDGFVRPCLVTNGVCDDDGQLTRCENGYCPMDGMCVPCDYTGTSKCANKIGCTQKTFTDNASCASNAVCYGSTFSGESQCVGDCQSYSSYGTTIFTDNSRCIPGALCAGAVFTGNSWCSSAVDNRGCGSPANVSTFKDNAVCAGTGCLNANYEGNACCATGSSCPRGLGVKKCEYNAQTGMFDRVGVW